METAATEHLHEFGGGTDLDDERRECFRDVDSVECVEELSECVFKLVIFWCGERFHL